VKIGIDKPDDDDSNKAKRRANHLDGETVVMYPKVYIDGDGNIVR